MGMFDAIKQRLRPSVKSERALTAYEEWRAGLAGSFAAMAYKQDFFADLLKGLPSDTARTLTARKDAIEAAAFQLWLPNYALRCSMRAIPTEELFSILDMGYQVLYKKMMEMGLAWNTIMHMEDRMRLRSPAYDAAANDIFFTRDADYTGSAHQFGHLVASNVFQEVTEDYRFVWMIFSSANQSIIAIAATFGKTKPPSR